jgi:hypothetical protein
MKRTEGKALETLAGEFGRVLLDPSEQNIHAFIEQHPQLLGFMHWDGFVKSKFRLAEVFVPDFLVVGLEPYSNVPRPLVTFIEVERSTEALFTKSGDPTSFLTHAIRQVQDWKRWVADNRTYLQTVLHRLIAQEIPAEQGDYPTGGREDIRRSIAHGFHDRYLVIAGRRDPMRLEDQLLLAQMNRDLHEIRIITYDVLLDGVLRDLDDDRQWHDLAGS